MYTHNELTQTVIKMHDKTGDAITDIDWELYTAQKITDNWRESISRRKRTNKQVRQDADLEIRYARNLEYLTDLLATANAITCPHCGNIIDDPDHLTWSGGGGTEPDEDSCVYAGITICPF